MDLYKKDIIRYGGGKPPKYQTYFRKYQKTKSRIIRKIYGIGFRRECKKNLVEISLKTKIGEGLYLGHATSITINPDTVIGKNVNIHKGVTIGQENRGQRKGTPLIGDEVWIGINSTIVGQVKIGNDVLIAPNTYVNFDVPDHSIVLGNPGVIYFKENATEGYINNKV